MFPMTNPDTQDDFDRLINLQQSDVNILVTQSVVGHSMVLWFNDGSWSDTCIRHNEHT